MNRTQHALTLIETLVVIAVVIILVAMLLPHLTHSGRAAGPICLSHQHQLLNAAALYASDSKDRFPNLDTLPGNDGPVALSLLLPAYVGRNTNVFICPYVARQREKDRPWYRKPFVPELNRAFLQSNGNDYVYYDGLTFQDHTNLILADRFAWTNRSALIPQLNHFDGSLNAGFVDGHCERVRPEVTLGTNLTPPWSAVQDPLSRP